MNIKQSVKKGAAKNGKSKHLPRQQCMPENRPKPKRKFIFQPSIFRGELLVSGRVNLICEANFDHLISIQFRIDEPVHKFVRQTLHVIEKCLHLEM